MKSSPEPIWSQHRRSLQEGQQDSKNGSGPAASDAGGGAKAPASSPQEGREKSSAASASVTGASTSSSASASPTIQIGLKLTRRLGKASVQGSFNKEEVLEVLKEVSGATVSTVALTSALRDGSRF